MLHQIRSLFIAFILVASGFAGGTLVFSSTANNTQKPDIWFIDNNAGLVESRGQTVSLDTTDLNPDVTQDQTAPLILTDNDRILSEIYQRVSPSVVAISVTRTGASFETFEEEIASSGSGFVIDNQGNIVTNYHVVEGANEIIVNFIDGTIIRAEVVGLDADSDIAVIRVDLPEERLFPVKFGSEKDLVIGQTVVAIGSPFQQRWTMTAGIVSALDRDIQGLGNYSVGSVIQTDAPINPGNSGGPLLNLAGEVIGVNSQIISQTRSNSGVGFAVPSTLVRRVAGELIESGRVDYSFVGISGGEITIELIEEYNLANNQRGLPIGNVIPNSPAARAGLRTISDNSVDIITSIDGIPITGFSSLIGYLAEKTRPGDTVIATVLRDGEVIEIPITLAPRP